MGLAQLIRRPANVASVVSPFAAPLGQAFPGVAPQLASSTPGLIGKLGGMGGLAKAGGWALGGQLASGAFDTLTGGEQSGTWDDAASGALTGAGIGAGLGSFIPGVGTLIGGALGGTAGGIYGALTGEDKNPEQQLSEVINFGQQQLGALVNQMNLSTEARESIKNQLAVAVLGVKDPKQVEQIYIQAAQMLPAVAEQERMQRSQLTNLLASQQVLAPQFDGFLKSMGADQRAFQASNNEFADIIGQANPAAGAFLKQQGAASILSDSATAAAYKNQLGMQFQQLAGQVGAPQSITDTLMAQYG